MPPLPLTIIRFAKNFDCYSAGELAGFLPRRAGELITHKLAAYVSGPVPDGVNAKERATTQDERAQALPFGASGPTDVPEERARRQRLLEMVQKLSAAQAVEAIKGVEAIDDLEIIQEGEVLHPDYQGGRKSVLEAITLRVKALQKKTEEVAAQ